MTRKDYQKIAGVLRDAKPYKGGKQARMFIAIELMAVCEDDNPRFDRDRFLIAAGISREEIAVA